MKNFWILFLGLIGLGACSEDKLAGYSSDSYIYFAKESTDSTIFSFAYDNQLTEGELKLKLNLVSLLESHERSFNVRFLPDESSAEEGKHFILNEQGQTIAANDSIGYLTLTIKKGDLNKNAVEAVFELVDSEDFKVGLKSNSKARVIISDKLSKPDWWDDWHITSGLGTYSDEKYTAFIEEIKVHDLTLQEDGGSFSYSEMRVLVLKFKRALELRPREELDGSKMTVAIKG